MPSETDKPTSRSAIIVPIIVTMITVICGALITGVINRLQTDRDFEIQQTQAVLALERELTLEAVRTLNARNFIATETANAQVISNENMSATLTAASVTKMMANQTESPSATIGASDRDVSANFRIECGEIIEGEIVPTQVDAIYFHEYMLGVRAGTIIDLIVEPLGQSFNVGFQLFDSGGSLFNQVNDNASGEDEMLIDYSVGTSNPYIRIYGMRPDSTSTFGFTDTSESIGQGGGRYYGAYSIAIGCTLRDGTRINPGDA